MKPSGPFKWLALVGSALAWSGNSLADVNCLDPELANAIAARHVQTQLMVGALHCRGTFDKGQRQFYDAFLQHFSRNIEAAHHYVLGIYRERHGSEATKYMDAYLTSLANQVSLALLEEPSQCHGLAVAGEKVAALDSIDWLKARSDFPIVLSDRDSGLCGGIDLTIAATAE